MTIKFFVPGKPATAGSKRVFLDKRTGKPIVTHDNKQHAQWRNLVRLAAYEEMDGEPLIEGPVKTAVTFVMRRPASVSVAKRPYPVVMPDIDKMMRAINDALTGAVFIDDSQVIIQHAMKVYGEPPGARVQVDEVAC
jgi:Holliday junction resolvase RusA-like endonuclease